MLLVRVCLFATAIGGLLGCTGGGDTSPASLPPPPAPPSASSSLGSVAPIERIIGPLTPTEAEELQPAPELPPAAPQGPPAVLSPPKTRTPAPIAAKPDTAAPSAAAITLDLETLKQQLKETKAIGIFSKISLKNKVDDLLDKFSQYYDGSSKGQAKFTLAELRESYNLLMMKVLSLLQEKDPMLASAIVSSREAIWGLLSDPIKFASLKV